MAEQNEQLGERTHEPTATRLQEARRRGVVPRSGELASSVAMLTGMIVLGLLAPGLVGSLTRMTAGMLGGEEGKLAVDASSLGDSLMSVLGPPVAALLPLALAVVTAAVLVGFAQAGFLWSVEAVKPDWQRVSPSAGLRRLTSSRTMIRGGLLAVKAGALGAIAWWTISASLPTLASAGGDDVAGMLAQAGGVLWTLTIRAGAVLLAIGLVDLLYQRWQHKRDLRMTRRELLDDLKQSEPRKMSRNKAAQSTPVDATTAVASATETQA